MRRLSVLFPLLAALVVTGCSSQSEEVNVYSARKEALIKPLLDRFTSETGITVNLITGSADALVERMKAEGEHSPADVLITTDAGRLYRAQQENQLAAVDSEVLNEKVPAALRDPDGHWYGLSVRARVVVYAPDRVDPSELSTYEALADPKWDDRICIRSSDNIYNQSLTASLIAHNGEAQTEQWAEGLVDNMARDPVGGDRDQIKALAAGECDLAVVNTYYLGSMQGGDDANAREIANQVAVFWPNQEGRGAHINISGAGVAANAPHPDNAVRLIEFLVNDQSQQWYAETNYEYPVRGDVPVSDVLREWGEFKQDDLPLVKLGEHNADALKLMDRAGWK
ncbi:MAG TPA: Fe(3+) ABC transporter substrate-binding protein [Alcanivorax sp.]|nr:Fe(3+) ABC transporter substrate-binding protein [Alcanivorax sp.]